MIVIIIIYIFLFHLVATQASTDYFVNEGDRSVGMLILINDICAGILT